MKTVILFLMMTLPAFALIGGERANNAQLVKIEKRTGHCTGTLVNARFVLTAAHCVARGEDFRIKDLDVIRVLIHPAYHAENWQKGRVSVDLALIEVRRGASEEVELTAKLPAISEDVMLYGFGSRVKGQAPKGELSSLHLKVTGRPNPLQVRLKGKGGACSGDSGGPAFNLNSQLFGVISWSSGVGNSLCGDLSGVSPLANHLQWVIKIINTKG